MPAAGSSSPARTFSRLVLPAPLRPTSPTLSPAATLKLASESTRRSATSMARFLTCSTLADVTCRDIQRLVCQLGNSIGRPSNEEDPRRHRHPRGGGRMRRRCRQLYDRGRARHVLWAGSVEWIDRLPPPKQGGARTSRH